MTPRLALALAAVCFLGGCYNDDGELVRQGQEAQTGRASYLGQTLASFALMNAQAKSQDAQPGRVIEASGNVRAASMVCLKDQGPDAYFLAWLQETEGLPRGQIRAAAAGVVGDVSVAAIDGGKIQTVHGERLRVTACPLPLLEEGAPVVVVPVKLQTPDLDLYAEWEYKSEPCAEGFEGVVMHKRPKFYKAGVQTVGEWEVTEVGKCVPAAQIVMTETARPLPAWSKGQGGTIDKALEEHSPTTCHTYTATGKSAGVSSSYTVDTCRTVQEPGPLLEVSALPPPPAPVTVFCTIFKPTTNGGQDRLTFDELAPRGFRFWPHDRYSWGAYYVEGDGQDWVNRRPCRWQHIDLPTSPHCKLLPNGETYECTK